MNTTTGSSRTRTRWWPDHLLPDVVLALVVGTIEIIGTYFAGQMQLDHRALDVVAFALLAAGVIAIVLRRQYPGGVLIFVMGVTVLYWLLDYPRGPIVLAIIVAFFTAVINNRRLIAWGVLALGFVSFTWLPYQLGNDPVPTPTGILGRAGWLLVLVTVAEIVHIRQQRIMRTREEEARRRSGEERMRIARELHDVLGHHISLISVQAGVALHLMDKQPEQARVSLSVIRETSKDALRELRSVLDVLRQVDEALPMSPSPGLSNLDNLISRASEAGIRVQTAISGDLERLPASVNLAAFRIVQEALTNVIRHSGQTVSSIEIACHGQVLTLRIDNAVSQGVSRAGKGAGQGILGMQERAAALGGVVEAGPHNDGFRVVARLPLDGNSLSTSGADE